MNRWNFGSVCYTFCFFDQCLLYSYKNTKVTKAQHWNWARFLCGCETQSVNQGEENNWDYWENKCAWGNVCTKVQRYKERENVGNHASPNIITVIRAGMITVNIPYFPAH